MRKTETEFLKEFEELLREEIKEACCRVERAIAYSVLTPGKRFRPLLIWSICNDLDVPVELVWHPALAVELFHTASLIHDDLPQIDDSPLRRGKPSCHVVFGNDTAILAGDGLMLKAFCVLSDSPAEPRKKEMLFQYFSRSTYQVLVGEALDVEYTGASPDLGEVLRMYAKKTGALFSFCFASGPILAGKFDLAERFSKLGEALGIWFQVQDDIKDACGDESKLGKPVGRDVALGKPTVVKILGLEQSKIFADKLLRSIMRQLGKLRLNNVRKLLEDLAKR
ncbi:geranyltranstransferase [Pseudothermotoga hypogea DSM 11164 = NBRC 106472]|uniref:Geranyltranstransferase n=1 Tax=Pseudothermotoga hypogea DSM 11164 = NBRC 106472 TaxID=1123384 RepID=A0A0X1KQH0_9THEM|nr:polyprenyl synthetase family protein [Pseudothermotoga hypogea]AJC73546.1 geranyltranstransferase [Pseudothermotoga hypogea DSM 11164 = NBRC 106472]MBC7122014.1 polyprenyl synthetase family protein [Pseudothermotoga sp.]